MTRAQASSASPAASVPSAAATGDGGGGERGPHRPRRWPAGIVIVLLIAIPAGYLVLSACQSRQGGVDKARSASAQGLVYEWPTKVQRRIYDIPIPDGATYVGHYETNSWGRSAMYVEFRTSSGRLSGFLEDLGSRRSELADGTVTIAEKDADVLGWRFDDPSRDYAGTLVQQSPSEPEVAITVDLTKEERPRVYVVSTVVP